MKTDRAIFRLCLSLGLILASSLSAQVPRGLELRLNRTTVGQREAPAVATAPGRGFVAAWHEIPSGSNTPVVKVRLFNAAGAARTGEIVVGTGRNPAVAMGTDGRFVVVWEVFTSTNLISLGRRFAADGHPLAAQFQLAPGDGHWQYDPKVAVAADGHFVTVWSRQDHQYDYETADVYGRIFAANGQPRGPQFAAIDLFEEQSAPRVALAADGSFVVVSNTFNGEGSFYDVIGRLFAADGTPAGEVFDVNDDPNTKDTSQFEPAVARAADGRFVVAWTDYGSDPISNPPLYQDGTGIRARRFAADGTPAGAEFRVNVFEVGMQQHPAVAITAAGSFLITWQSGANEDGDKDGIFARAFAPNGTPRGGDFRINIARTGAQTDPAMVLGGDGHGVAAWVTPDGNGTGIDSRVLVLSN